MGFEAVEKKLEKIKTDIKKIDPKKKLKFTFVVIWLFVMGTGMCTGIGKTIILVCGYVSFILTVSLALYYVYLEFENDIKLKQEVQSAESNEQVKSDNGVLDKSFELAEEESEEDSCYEFKDSITTRKQPLRVVKDTKKTYYLLDASTFFALEEYTRERGYAISDIIYGDMCLNDAIAVLAEAIKTRRCYVTSDVLSEIIRAEQVGKLKKGTSEFIEEDLSIWDAPALAPENYEKLMSQKDLDENKKYKPKHYKLIWSAMCMSEKRKGKVFIVSTSKKMLGLAEANSLEIVDPFMIQEEEKQ